MSQQRFTVINRVRPVFTEPPKRIDYDNARIVDTRVEFGKVGAVDNLCRTEKGSVIRVPLNATNHLLFHAFTDPDRAQSHLNYAVDIWENGVKVEGTYTLHVEATPFDLLNPRQHLLNPRQQRFRIKDDKGEIIDLSHKFCRSIEIQQTTSVLKSLLSDEVLTDDDDDLLAPLDVRPTILSRPSGKRDYLQSVDLTTANHDQKAKEQKFKWNAVKQDPAAKHLSDMFAGRVKHKPIREKADAENDSTAIIPLFMLIPSIPTLQR